MTKSLRNEMPSTTEFIDDLRAAFGAEEINSSIRAGVNGQPTFWARENGQEVGTKAPEPALSISGADLFNHRINK